MDRVSLISGHSKSKIQRIFKHYLATPPVFTIPQKERVHIILDGTYFSNDICLVVYRNNDIRCTQLYRLSNIEHYEEIREDLENLKAFLAYPGSQEPSLTGAIVNNPKNPQDRYRRKKVLLA